MMKRLGDNIIISALIYAAMLIILIFILFFVYFRNINSDYKKFIQVKKVFKVCNINE